jgi:hypothetical protein
MAQAVALISLVFYALSPRSSMMGCITNATTPLTVSGTMLSHI